MENKLFRLRYSKSNFTNNEYWNYGIKNNISHLDNRVYLYYIKQRIIVSKGFMGIRLTIFYYGK